jgi:hypothetical protein
MDRIRDGEARSGQILRRFTTWLVVTGLASLISLFTLLGLVADWIPGLKSEPPPPELAVKLGDVRLEERTTDEYGFDLLAVSFDADFTGYKGKRIPVEWAAFDPNGQVRLALDPIPGNVTDRGTWDGGAIRAEAKNDQANIRIEFRPPNQGQCLLVRIYVYDDDLTRLDYADSKPFDTDDPGNARCQQPTAVATPDASSGV